ncbi:MAG: restriction endonuclease subunit S [Bacillota bacterium]
MALGVFPTIANQHRVSPRGHFTIFGWLCGWDGCRFDKGLKGRFFNGNYVKIQGGYAFKSDEYRETGLPIVRISNLEDETVHTIGSPCIDESRLAEFSRFVLKPGDILIALTGATTGKLGIVPATCHNWLLNQRVGRFLPRKPDELAPKYVYWLARGVQKQIFEAAYGGAQPNISPNDIEAMEFPFPPLSEQRRIVAYLDEVQACAQAIKQAQEQTQIELQALEQAILDKAFRGELE